MNELYNSHYIKYLIILGILYTLLKIVPNPKLQHKDIILILFIVVFTIYSVDYKNNNKIIIDNFDNNITLPVVMSNQLENKINMISKPTTQTSYSQPVQEAMQQISYSQPVQEAMQQISYSQPVQEAIPSNIQTKDTIEKKYYNILLNDLINKKVLNSNDVVNINIKLDSKLFTMEDIITSLEQMNKATKYKNTKHQPNKLLRMTHRMDVSGNQVNNSSDISINNINDSDPNTTSGISINQTSNDSSNNMIQTNNDTMYNELLPSKMEPLGTHFPSTWSSDYTILNTDKWKVPMYQPPVCINTTPCKVCPDDAYPYLGLKNWDNSRKISNININNKWTQNQNDSSKL
jgi:hypothetical protein